MSQCVKCGIDTNNPPFSYDNIRGPDPLADVGDTNGVIWLCDHHQKELAEWLENDIEWTITLDDE